MNEKMEIKCGNGDKMRKWRERENEEMEREREKMRKLRVKMARE